MAHAQNRVKFGELMGNAILPDFRRASFQIVNFEILPFLESFATSITLSIEVRIRFCQTFFIVVA